MNTARYRILIVDDVEENRQLLGRRLTKEGFHTETAREGREALQTLRQNPPDLVLLDIDMPVMDGVSVLKAIQADLNLARIPVVMLTGLEDASLALDCIKKGASGYLMKPFNMKELNQQINHCLAGRANASA